MIEDPFRNLIKEDEDLHTIPGSKLKILQKKKGYKGGLEAFQLVEFAKPYLKKGAKIIDLGTGNGIIPILLSEICPNLSHIVGLEIQPELVDLASRNVLGNSLKNLIEIQEGDFTLANKLFKRASFDVVLTNPPFYLEGKGKKSPYQSVNIARLEKPNMVKSLIQQSYFLLKEKGFFFVISHPFRLMEYLFYLQKYKLNAVKLRLIHHTLSTPAVFFCLMAQKGEKKELVIDHPVILSDEKI